MVIDDEYIKNLNKGRKIYKQRRFFKDNEIQYIENRFVDSKSFSESIWRIMNGIYTRPVCQICGKPVEFIGRKNNIFSKTCCEECRKLLTYPKSKISIANISNDKRILSNHKRALSYYLKNPEILHKYLANHHKTKEEIIEKTKRTNIERYGGTSPSSNPKVKQKQINTRLEKYDGKYTIFSNELKKYLSYIQKQDSTQKKIQETNIRKYGVNYYSQSEEFKEYLKKNREIIFDKINATKRKNKSFNTSKQEIETFNLLQQKFTDTIKEYKDKIRYPFNCDFYIPSKDLFIECNYHWTHGGHPYNSNDINDVNIKNKWESSNKQYYINAVNTWTIRDTNKREIAKQNKLNWIEFFSIKEFKDWFENN